MKKNLIALMGLFLLCSHDMYLKMDTYFVDANQQATIHLYNGTFDKSENVIDRDRMLDASLTGNGERYKITDDQWSEKDSITILSFKTGDSGTWVAGVSTKPRSIEMKADAFNKYLEHDGVLDMLEWRQENKALDKDAVEQYSKHVKTIFQVGDKTSDDWNANLGYPIEFIPMSNPYDKHTGDDLKVKLLLKGEPLTNQLVYADYKPTENGHTHGDSIEHSHADQAQGHSHEEEEHSHSATAKEHSHSHEKSDEAEHGHSHDHDKAAEHSHDHDENNVESHQHTSGQQLRTDENGVLTMNLKADGIWYLRTIHLAPSEEEGLTHESNWATLTFEVVHGHSHEAGAEGHVHEEEDGFPSYLFWIGSLLILGGLFFWFNKKKE
ncbi:DUF4198 domain-containing protein [Pseudozobellia sp. WGM2]|uniref:DUF4198 domain-containing protein n=1 Tax=Pseudozobellia sp. WGM2 TaxID=2787625 RepID=UPI001FD77734|nr:DUF4198 domain-containing protein [Pseudozobellia sp. WGM2]